MSSLVNLTVTQLVASAPINLQQTGALISQGATTLGANNYGLLTQPSDLTALLAAPLALSGITWSGGTATATAAAALPGLSAGDHFETTIAGAVPSGYNGTVQATATGADTFTYAVASNPGAIVTPGTYTPNNQVELQAMVNSFFAQGGSTSVYVLELGATDKTTGPTALGTWITTNPLFFYSYLVPRGWDAQANYLSLLALYEAPTALTYFFTTTTTGNYASYTAQMKDVLLTIEAPAVNPATEFSAAAEFNAALSYNPSSKKMTSFNGQYLYGPTPYPTQGNSALLTTLAAANVTVVGTGAQGGSSTATIGNSAYGPAGRTLDGKDFSYWFEVDYMQLNLARNVVAYILENGPNNSVNPLAYDQDGIDRLQDVCVSTTQSALTFGVANGTIATAQLDPTAFGEALDADTYEDQCVTNAVTFLDYSEENPNDYGNGKYNGLTQVFIPQAFFEQVGINLLVTNLIAL